MTQKLPNYLSGQWQTGTGAGTPLFDPVLGTELVKVDATGLDLAAGFAFAREQGGRSTTRTDLPPARRYAGSCRQSLAGATHALIDVHTVDADTNTPCCVGPTLLGTRSALGSDTADRVHDTEVFGPAATLVPYRDAAHAFELIRRGQGSLVTSIYGSDSASLAAAALCKPVPLYSLR